MRQLSRPFGWFAAADGATRAALVALVLIVIAIPALMPVVATPRTTPREIVLVARDMAFHLEGATEANPTIALKPSEEVRFVVRNQDTGITHALSVGPAGASIDRIVPGTTEQIEYQAPDQPGRYEYLCPPHARMMKGVLLVTD